MIENQSNQPPPRPPLPQMTSGDDSNYDFERFCVLVYIGFLIYMACK